MNGDFQSTLNNLLSNPEALRGLMSIASTMMGASSQTSADTSSQSSASSPMFGGSSPQASSSASSPIFGSGSQQSSLGASSPTFAQASSGDNPSSLEASPLAELARRSDDHELHQTGEPTHGDGGGQQGSLSLDKLLSLSPKSSKNDPRCTLLYALKPYLSPTRRDKVDSLVKAIQLVSLASGLFGGKLF